MESIVQMLLFSLKRADEHILFDMVVLVVSLSPSCMNIICMDLFLLLHDSVKKARVMISVV
jgi:hypothetical protein